MQQRNSVLCLSPKTNTQIKRDRKKRITRKSVLKMLAVMEASQSAPGPSNPSQVPAATPEEQAANEKDFLSSGRTGRRNAMPDILAPNFIIESDSKCRISDTAPDSEKCEDDEKSATKEKSKESIGNKNPAVIEKDLAELPNVIVIIRNKIKEESE